MLTRDSNINPRARGQKIYSVKVYKYLTRQSIQKERKETTQPIGANKDRMSKVGKINKESIWLCVALLIFYAAFDHQVSVYSKCVHN